MSVTKQSVKCQNCGRSTSFVKDSALEATGICTSCAEAKAKAAAKARA